MSAKVMTSAVLFVAVLFAPSLGRVVQLEPETAPESRRKLAGHNSARCGKSWYDANRKCGVVCDGSTDAPCVPYGEKCWSDLDTSVCQSSSGGTSSTARCGSTWYDADRKCGVVCDGSTDAPCVPYGEKCWSDLDTSVCQNSGGGSGGSSGTVAESGTTSVTNYISYPECCENPDADDQTECKKYNACQWAGFFAAVDGQLSLNEVQLNDIVSFYKPRGGWSDEFYHKYAGKKIRLTFNGGAKVFTAGILDTCSDSDCGGCCTDNAGSNGVLVDIELNTIKRWFPDVDADSIEVAYYEVLNEDYVLKR